MKVKHPTPRHSASVVDIERSFVRDFVAAAFGGGDFSQFCSGRPLVGSFSFRPALQFACEQCNRKKERKMAWLNATKVD